MATYTITMLSTGNILPKTITIELKTFCLLAVASDPLGRDWFLIVFGSFLGWELFLFLHLRCDFLADLFVYERLNLEKEGNFLRRIIFLLLT